MAHQIIVNGKVLDPKRAAANLLPGDTALACPRCESQQCGANEPRYDIKYKGETQLGTPRLQDRWCFACGHQWAAVLPPEQIASQPLHVPGR